MATITSFEGLSMPGKSELRQFAELFVPLYENSSHEARRLAVAALSQCPTLPKSIVCFLATQPIEIAAPFLLASKALDDEVLITVARTQGSEHARAIAGRSDLSVAVVDALVGMHQDVASSHLKAVPQAKIVTLPDRRGAERLVAEDKLRLEIKNLVRHTEPQSQQQAGTISPMTEALLVRFARQRQNRAFCLALADALASSLWLAERIMLDLSGQQLATTLVALNLGAGDGQFILERLYPHLAAQVADKSEPQSRASVVWAGIDAKLAAERVANWLRADAYTMQGGSGLVSGETVQAPPANHNLPAEKADAQLLHQSVQADQRRNIRHFGRAG